ncbi:GumC family protein [Oceaniglobus roseus]|uniref:GumC family protein n=1 Tax=Oceaniglobus roseus TaxID=1737570 RepID=UPI000C7ED027|nr:polysaccharide biosynthesis tyrosine autokinase [Kandeliimicrobium roseum]
MNASSAQGHPDAARSPGSRRLTDLDAVDARALMAALWRGRWRILGLSFAAGLLVWLAMMQVTPTYSVTSKLMLDTRKAQIVGSNEVVADIVPSEQVVNSEIAVLRSNIVIEKMLDAMTPDQLALLDPDLKPESLKSRVKGFVKGLFVSPPPPLSPEAEAQAHRIRMVDAVRQMRNVYAESDSFVMAIRVDSSSPELARDVANGLADAYIGLQLDNRRAAVSRATTWLEARLAELKGQVEEAERAVARFEAKSLIDDGGTLQSVTDQLADLNKELAKIRAERVAAESRLDQLTALLRDQGVEAAAQVLETPTMKELSAQLLELRQNDAVWARSYGESNPRRVRNRQQMDEILSAMRVELDNAVAAQRSALVLARGQEKGVEDSISTLEGKVMSMTDNQLDLRQLNREADASRQTYESFLVRIAEARAQRELQQPDSVLVERAILPEAPSAPRPMLLATLAMTVTAAFAASWVLFGEMTPNTFRTSQELSNATGLSVLTSLPKGNWPDTGDMLADLRNNPYSFYAERVRQLRTALSLRRDTTGRGQSVMILASAPGEGKTTTALALAQMAVLSGRSAIVVDCDLRRPKVLASLGSKAPLMHDFADFIEDECDLPDAICAPAGYDFDVLAAQRPRRAAADALAVSWLGPVLRELERAYDFVIVDAPALLAVPDALIAAQEVNTRFFLVSHDHTPRSAVQRSLSTLGEMGVEVRGLILNKVDARTSTDTVEGKYGYEYWVKDSWSELPGRPGWIGVSSRSEGGDHPLLAGRDAGRREGT